MVHGVGVGKACQSGAGSSHRYGEKYSRGKTVTSGNAQSTCVRKGGPVRGDGCRRRRETARRLFGRRHGRERQPSTPVSTSPARRTPRTPTPHAAGGRSAAGTRCRCRRRRRRAGRAPGSATMSDRAEALGARSTSRVIPSEGRSSSPQSRCSQRGWWPPSSRRRPVLLRHRPGPEPHPVEDRAESAACRIAARAGPGSVAASRRAGRPRARRSCRRRASARPRARGLARAGSARAARARPRSAARSPTRRAQAVQARRARAFPGRRAGTRGERAAPPRPPGPALARPVFVTSTSSPRCSPAYIRTSGSSSRTSQRHRPRPRRVLLRERSRRPAREALGQVEGRVQRPAAGASIAGRRELVPEAVHASVPRGFRARTEGGRTARPVLRRVLGRRRCAVRVSKRSEASLRTSRLW